MRKTIFLILLASIGFLIAGCEFQSLETFKNSPTVKQFLEEHPDADILAVHLTAQETEQILPQLQEVCGEFIEAQAYMKIEITDIESNTKVLVLTDPETGYLECARKIGAQLTQQVNFSVPKVPALQRPSVLEDLPGEVFEDVPRDKLSQVVIVHRKHFTCDGKQIDQELGFGDEEIIDVAKTGYGGYFCRNMYQHQCIDDGSFDTYYDEWCEFADGTNNRDTRPGVEIVVDEHVFDLEIVNLEDERMLDMNYLGQNPVIVNSIELKNAFDVLELLEGQTVSFDKGDWMQIHVDAKSLSCPIGSKYTYEVVVRYTENSEAKVDNRQVVVLECV